MIEGGEVEIDEEHLGLGGGSGVVADFVESLESAVDAE